MESAAYPSSNSSSASSIYFTTNNTSSWSVQSRSSTTDYLPPQKSFYSSLHSIQGTEHKYKQGNSNKPFLNKKLPIAPLPPNRPPKVYKVHPINFKELVQNLTGASAAQPRRMQNLAPAPLDLLGDRQQQQPPPPLQQLLPPTHSTKSVDVDETESPFSALYRELMTTETTAAATSNDNNNYNYNYNYSNVMTESVITSSSTSLDLNLGSPTSQHCWYSPLLSPAAAGNLIASLDHPQRTIL
ncbi:hypothetical protein LINGRAHAP2_LOCUS30519 [Linum grandiflorum]